MEIGDKSDLEHKQLIKIHPDIEKCKIDINKLIIPL